MIVFDENVPPGLAVLLSSLGEPASDVRLMGLGGSDDEQFLPHLVAGVDCVVTKDRDMIRRPEVIALCRERRLGMFFLPKDNLPALRMCQLVINAWGAMLRLAETEERPFYAKLHVRGSSVSVARRPGAL